MKKVVVPVLIAGAAVVLFFAARIAMDRLLQDADPSEEGPSGDSPTVPDIDSPDADEQRTVARVREEDSSDAADNVAEDEDEDSVDESDETEADGSEDAEDAAVEAFDTLTDEWQEPSKREITMGDIEKFGSTFRNIPAHRRDECVNRALNLIPDENVMLLAGILMDKSLDQEIIETVFNDVLNRDEEVKEPILQQIFKDKEHPCWADVAWILDVTGELPEKN